MTIKQRIKAAQESLDAKGTYLGVVTHNGFRFSHLILKSDNNKFKYKYLGTLSRQVDLKTQRIICIDMTKDYFNKYTTLEDAIHGEFDRYKEDNNSQSGCIQKEFIAALAFGFISMLIGSILTLKILIHLGAIK
jgi:hypothetical protein